MDKLQILSKYLLSLALIYFSTSLLLFVNEIGQTRKALPILIEKLDSIENSANVQEVLRLAVEVTKNTAHVSDQVSAFRKDLPKIYREVEKTRKIIPGILEEVRAVRSDLPVFYNEVDKTRAVIPEVLIEVRALRKEMPKLLAETGALLDRAEKASDRAGKGAVHGVIKGIFTTPLHVIESVISDVKEKISGKEEKVSVKEEKVSVEEEKVSVEEEKVSVEEEIKQ